MKKILVVLIIVAALATSCGGHRTVTYHTRPHYAPTPTVIYVQPRPHSQHTPPPPHRPRGRRW